MACLVFYKSDCYQWDLVEKKTAKEALEYLDLDPYTCETIHVIENFDIGTPPVIDAKPLAKEIYQEREERKAKEREEREYAHFIRLRSKFEGRGR